MDKLDKVSNFHRLCIKNCINHHRASVYKNKHKELTDEEVIQACRKNMGYKDNEKFTLDDYCRAAEVSKDDVLEFIDDVTADLINRDPKFLQSMSNADWVINYINTFRCGDIESICEIAKRRGLDISVPRFKGLQRKHPDWTKEEILGYCMLNESKPNKLYQLTVNNEQYVLSGLCKILGLNYNAIRENVIENGTLNTNKLLAIAPHLGVNLFGELIFVGIDLNNTDVKGTNKTKKSLKRLCDENGVRYETARQFKLRNHGVSNELTIKYYTQPEKLTLKDKCDIAGVNARQVYHYKDAHPSVTDKQAIKAVKQKAKRRKTNESK